MTTNSLLIGKYVNVDNLHYDFRDGYTGGICYCKSLNGTTYTLVTRANKEHFTTADHIKSIVNITKTQKFIIGDIVDAVIDTIGPYHDTINDYCKVVGVNIFANDIDYVLIVIKTGKRINVSQEMVYKKVYMPTPKYIIGQSIGVKIHKGCQFDYWTEISNGKITEVKSWYNGVKYIVKLDSGETIEKDEYDITTPKVIKTPQQVKQEELEFLQQREIQLMAELEFTRKALGKI
jgi:hypothetical protein